MKVLVVEDDELTRKGLVEVLSTEGYQTVEAADGLRALEAYDRERPDFICLDIMMPELDGYEVCRRIRAQDPDVPVIFLSAKGEEIDRVVGLELGADDFITKPFGVREVVARIRAVTRRCLARECRAGDTNAGFTMVDLEIVPDELRARRGEVMVDLSLRELRILELLHTNRGRVVDRDSLFNHCWGLDYLPSSRTLDQAISQLRKKIEVDPKRPEIISTVHGVGYRFDG
jgi:DNA-binding response OmpR family regulator